MQFSTPYFFWDTRYLIVKVIIAFLKHSLTITHWNDTKTHGVIIPIFIPTFWSPWGTPNTRRYTVKSTIKFYHSLRKYICFSGCVITVNTVKNFSVKLNVWSSWIDIKKETWSDFKPPKRQIMYCWNASASPLQP